MTNHYRGPLAGLNVIDFGHYYAGPMAAMLLADQGATVIRIVRPGQPELPEQQCRLLNRNKKVLELDLKTEEGKAQALSLIERADVLIENFRPGVMKRLGLDYTSTKKGNPHLIYLSLPGFASTDKERAHLQAWEGILGAASGTYRHMSLLSMFPTALNHPPVYTAAPHCSVYGAIQGAVAVMAALVAREKHGIGTVIEAPLVECGLWGFVWSRFSDTPTTSSTNDSSFTPFAFLAEDSLVAKADKLNQAERMSRKQFGGALGNFYSCADGRMIYVWVCFYKGLSERLFKALGLDKQLKREGFVNEGAWVTGLDNNPSSFSGFDPTRQKRLKQLMADTFLTKTTEDWDSIFKDAGIPATVFRTRSEWLALEPMLKTGVLVNLKQGKSVLTVPGRLADVSPPDENSEDALFQIEGDGNQTNPYREAEYLTATQANEFFQHRAKCSQIIATPSPLKKGDLLKGLKVLDLNNVLAGPTSGHLLAQFGADVIKADSAGFQDPPAILIPLMEHNQGKRSILTDVTSAPGRDVFERLLGWSDVLVHNLLDDSAKRLGIAQSQLQSINPNLVSAQLSAFGGSSRGGWEGRPGFDPVIQSATGLPAQYGSLNEPHLHHMALSADTMGGFSLAFAALLGVYQQRKTGDGCEVRTSLVRANCHYQLPWMIAENGQSDGGEARGPLALGESLCQRLYACRDGWIYVGTQEQRAPVLAEIITGQPAVAPVTLEAAFAKQDCNHWLAKLNAAAIASHRVLDINQLLADKQERQVSNEDTDETAQGPFEMLRRDQHPCGKAVSAKAPDHIRIGQDHSYKRLTPAPRLGEHTREILGELGYSESEVDELIRIKASHDYLPGMGSKKNYFFEQEKQ